MPASENNGFLISHYTLRRTIGWLGLSMPFVLVLFNSMFGTGGMRRSISAYYFSNMQDYFVGVLFAIGCFLITYRGYARQDNLITTAMGLAGFGIAVFPADALVSDIPANLGVFGLAYPVSRILHGICAATFFILMAYLAYFVFTKSHRPPAAMTAAKKIRNGIYRLSGAAVAGATISIALVELLAPDFAQGSSIVFWLEALALMFFSLAWLVKGELVLKDDAE